MSQKNNNFKCVMLWTTTLNELLPRCNAYGYRQLNCKQVENLIDCLRIMSLYKSKLKKLKKLKEKKIKRKYLCIYAQL